MLHGSGFLMARPAPAVHHGMVGPFPTPTTGIGLRSPSAILFRDFECNRYLADARVVSLDVSYAMYRGCPLPGMSEREIVASWGEPARRTAGTDSVTVLLYGFGVEGQHHEFGFHNDSLASVRYVD